SAHPSARAKDASRLFLIAQPPSKRRGKFPTPPFGQPLSSRINVLVSCFSSHELQRDCADPGIFWAQQCFEHGIPRYSLSSFVSCVFKERHEEFLHIGLQQIVQKLDGTRT